MTAPELRIFFAHPKAWDEGFIAARTQELVDALRVLRDRSGQGTRLRVVTGRDDWQETVGSGPRGRNGWQQWIGHTSTGVRADGEPRYHVFIIPNGPVGKATGGLIQMALYAGKPVSCWDTVDCTLVAVTGVVQESESHSEGWRMVCDGPVTRITQQAEVDHASDRQ